VPDGVFGLLGAGLIVTVKLSEEVLLPQLFIPITLILAVPV
jgi:hypothetical protein